MRTETCRAGDFRKTTERQLGPSLKASAIGLRAVASPTSPPSLTSTPLKNTPKSCMMYLLRFHYSLRDREPKREAQEGAE
ncbi:MAG: hypothetical protein WC721_21880, partial [Victivallaceae bacterium]